MNHVFAFQKEHLLIVSHCRNYMKFTVPLAHTLTLISWGAIEWSEGYEKANQTRYLHDMLRWGTDWLIKAHPSDSVLFVQVADGDIDNDYWGMYGDQVEWHL